MGSSKFIQRLTELHDRNCSEKNGPCVFSSILFTREKTETAQYYNYTALKTMQ